MLDACADLTEQIGTRRYGRIVPASTVVSIKAVFTSFRSKLNACPRPLISEKVLSAEFLKTGIGIAALGRRMQQQDTIERRPAALVRLLAWLHSRRAALTLERLGLPACLLVAYFHPTMLWTTELPMNVRLFGVVLSVAGAAFWFALGLSIYRLQPAAPAVALFVYLAARFGHMSYAKLGHGVEEDIVTLAVTGAVILLLSVSVYGTVERRRRAHTTYLGRTAPY